MNKELAAIKRLAEILIGLLVVKLILVIVLMFVR